MREWVANSRRCRRLGLAMQMDGRGTNYVLTLDCIWCDVCRSKLRLEREQVDVYERMEEEDDDEAMTLEPWSQYTLPEDEEDVSGVELWSQYTLAGDEDEVLGVEPWSQYTLLEENI